MGNMFNFNSAINRNNAFKSLEKPIEKVGKVVEKAAPIAENIGNAMAMIPGPMEKVGAGISTVASGLDSIFALNRQRKQEEDEYAQMQAAALGAHPNYALMNRKQYNNM